MTLNRPLLISLLSASCFLFLELFVPPAIPISSGGDEMVYLHDAARIVQGETLYRDIFQFTPPGTELVFTTLIKIFGPRAWIPNAVLMALGIGLTLIGVFVSSRVLRRSSVLLPGLAFLVLGFKSWLDATHHWFSLLLAMAAVAMLIDTTELRRVLLAGVLCGFAAAFTQTHGLMAFGALATFLVWEHRNAEGYLPGLLRCYASLFGGFVCGFAICSSYFASSAGVGQFLYCTMVFPTKYFTDTHRTIFRCMPGTFLCFSITP